MKIWLMVEHDFKLIISVLLINQVIEKFLWCISTKEKSEKQKTTAQAGKIMAVTPYPHPNVKAQYWTASLAIDMSFCSLICDDLENSMLVEEVTVDVNESSSANQLKKRKISHNRKRVQEDVNPIGPGKRPRGRPRKTAA